jgi:hypothetical protein
VMGAAPHHTDGNGAAAVSAPGANRPMTEMAAPVMGGGPPIPNPNAMTPAYGGAAPAVGPSSGGAPIAIPAGPVHGATTGEKKGGMGIVIGLGALAILLIGGGVAAYALRGKPKPATGDPLADLSAASSVTAPVETAAVADDDAGGATPLGATSGLAATTTTTIAAKTGTGPAIKPATASVPTPKIAPPPPPPPPKPDPPVCAKARDAARRNSPGAVNLQNQCRAAGGVP